MVSCKLYMLSSTDNDGGGGVERRHVFPRVRNMLFQKVSTEKSNWVYSFQAAD